MLLAENRSWHEIATQIAKLPSSTTSLSFDAPPRGTPRISAYGLYFRKLKSLGYISAADSMGPSSFVIAVVASQTCEVAQNSEKIWTYSSSRSSKIIDFGTNRKRICDFLLVRHSNLGHILHRFWDMATYWLKITYFSYPSVTWRPAPYMFPLEFRSEVNREETKVMGLFVMKVAWS